MKRIIFLVGPTAIGKTKTALSLAKKINAQIVSCDSMQIYKEMNILSAKPSKLERKKVAHYLLDQLSVTKKFNVADYQKEALVAIKKIHKKGKTPLVVGGSGLYMQVLLDGVFAQNKKSLLVRSLLYQRAKKYGKKYLYKRLQRIDSQAASKIHPNDLRRIVRALEVFDATGVGISKLQKKRQGGVWGKYEVKILALNCKRDELYQRVNSRTEKMFKQGLVREVKGLLKKPLSQTASCAIGIKEIKAYLAGDCQLDEAKKRIALNSRHFAKRQLTWFRKEKRINWLEISKKDTPEVIANRLKRLMDLLGLKPEVSLDDSDS